MVPPTSQPNADTRAKYKQYQALIWERFTPMGAFDRADLPVKLIGQAAKDQ